jgi:hypothetical protein
MIKISLNMGNESVGRAVFVLVNAHTGALVKENNVLVLVYDVKLYADALKGMLVDLFSKNSSARKH